MTKKVDVLDRSVDFDELEDAINDLKSNKEQGLIILLMNFSSMQHLS